MEFAINTGDRRSTGVCITHEKFSVEFLNEIFLLCIFLKFLTQYQNYIIATLFLRGHNAAYVL